MARKRSVAPDDYMQEMPPTPLEQAAQAGAEHHQAVRASAEQGVTREAEVPPHPSKPKPVHEIRLSRVKATVWANHTGAGVRHNVTVARLFKPEGGQWQESHSFGRDELPIAAEVLRRAWLWILEHGSQQ